MNKFTLPILLILLQLSFQYEIIILRDTDYKSITAQDPTVEELGDQSLTLSASQEGGDGKITYSWSVVTAEGQDSQVVQNIDEEVVNTISCQATYENTTAADGTITKTYSDNCPISVTTTLTQKDADAITTTNLTFSDFNDQAQAAIKAVETGKFDSLSLADIQQDIVYSTDDSVEPAVPKSVQLNSADNTLRAYLFDEKSLGCLGLSEATLVFDPEYLKKTDLKETDYKITVKQAQQAPSSAEKYDVDENGQKKEVTEKVTPSTETNQVTNQLDLNIDLIQCADNKDKVVTYMYNITWDETVYDGYFAVEATKLTDFSHQQTVTVGDVTVGTVTLEGKKVTDDDCSTVFSAKMVFITLSFILLTIISII